MDGWRSGGEQITVRSLGVGYPRYIRAEVTGGGVSPLYQSRNSRRISQEDQHERCPAVTESGRMTVPERSASGYQTA